MDEMVVDGETGFVISPKGDVAGALAQALRRLVDDAALRQSSARPPGRAPRSSTRAAQRGRGRRRSARRRRRRDLIPGAQRQPPRSSWWGWRIHWSEDRAARHEQVADAVHLRVGADDTSLRIGVHPRAARGMERAAGRRHLWQGVPLGRLKRPRPAPCSAAPSRSRVRSRLRRS